MADYEDVETVLGASADPRILCLTKVGREDHLTLLRQGQLRCQRLSSYKKVEGEPLAFQDAHEGLIGIFQADRVELDFTPRAGTPIVFNAKGGLVKQIYASAKNADPIFCLHAIHAGAWPLKVFGEDELDAFKAHLQIPESMSKFGTHIWVITNGDEFARRLQEGCAQENIVCSGSLVKYVDPTRVHGVIPETLSAFVKRSSFKDEREYRFLFRSARALPDPFVLNIGSLEDISLVMPLDDFRKSWAISWPEVER